MRYPGLHHVLVRHEQNAAHAADGYARTTGKVGVCVATSGPGATNLLTGLATAFMDCVPVVALTGQVARARDRDAGVSGSRRAGHGRADHQGRVPAALGRGDPRGLRPGISTGRRRPPGPVLIDFPKDVQMARVEVEDALPNLAPPSSDPTLSGAAEFALEQAAASAASR